MVAIEIGHIVQNFTVIMVVASIVALVSYKLKQPMVIGYIIAGMIIGPYTTYSCILAKVSTSSFLYFFKSSAYYRDSI